MTVTQVLGVGLAVAVFAWRALYGAWAWRSDRQRHSFWAFDLPILFVIALAVFIAVR
jgi:hypothetical protein